jgi:hypothetical protein
MAGSIFLRWDSQRQATSNNIPPFDNVNLRHYYPRRLGMITKEMVLSEAKTQLKMNQSMLEMLKGNTDLEDLARLRDAWVTPLEELVRGLESETTVAPSK